MFGTGLYYPYIDIHDGAWLRSAILFWDEIQTIVPSTISRPYQEADTKTCEDEGYLRPLRCDLHGDLLNQLGRRIINLVQKPGGLQISSQDPNETALINAQKFGHSLRDEIELARLHPAKLSPELRALFPGEPNVGAGETEWLLVNSNFANVYMAALAATLAKEIDVSPLTNEEASLGINLRCLIDDVAQAGEGAAKGALLTVVMEGLRIDPETRIGKLIAFRRSRGTQLAEMSAAFDQLESTIKESEDKNELTEKAQRAFNSNVRPKLEKLKDELLGQSIQSVWEEFYRAITVTLPGGSALAHFTSWTAPVLLGAGAFLTLADVGIKSYFARRRARAASPYTYLLDIERKFSLPRYS
jgi:hypothetical protein